MYFEKGFKMKFFAGLLSKIPGTDEYTARQIKEQTHNAVARNGSDAVFLAKLCDGIETVCTENGVYRYRLKNINYAFDVKYILITHIYTLNFNYLQSMTTLYCV